MSGFTGTLVGDLLNYFDFEEKRPRISLHPLELVVQASLFLARRRASVNPTVRDALGKRSLSGSFRDRFEYCPSDGDSATDFFVIHFHILLVLRIR